MTVSFWLPELVDLNTYISAERSNRFKGAAIKKRMTDLVVSRVRSQCLPKMSQITSFSMTWFHKDKRKDFDNVEFGVKWIKDGLVKAGVIKNDGWKHFPPRTVHEHMIAKTEPCVCVSIEYV